MKTFASLVFFVMSAAAFAQLPGSGERLTGPVTTRKGIVLKEGDDLRFGEGIHAGGTYRYIFLSFAKFGDKASHLEEGYAYKHAVIREFREVGSGNDRRLVALVKPKGGISVYFRAIDLEPAMESKEIISVNGVAISKLVKKNQL
ncbi:hypothetical protein [Larkinella soli]|uniref:hypothetical protein n=1 Tax=Larkinella soli TaxID=1770527 RepID=UPI000FFB3566|nr:hypothetical protein [Larkinella soli]